MQSTAASRLMAVVVAAAMTGRIMFLGEQFSDGKLKTDEPILIHSSRKYCLNIPPNIPQAYPLADSEQLGKAGQAVHR